jgi:hypothetical protein
LPAVAGAMSTYAAQRTRALVGACGASVAQMRAPTNHVWAHRCQSMLRQEGWSAGGYS